MKLIIFTDGASRGNPGPASYGFVIMNEKKEVIEEVGKGIGITTNNVAEYMAVVESLTRVKQLYADKLPVEINYFADSKLVVEQLSGRFKIKSPHLKVLIEQIRQLQQEVGKVTFTHVFREQNKLADRMANLALDNNL